MLSESVRRFAERSGYRKNFPLRKKWAFVGMQMCPMATATARHVFESETR